MKKIVIIIGLLFVVPTNRACTNAARPISAAESTHVSRAESTTPLPNDMHEQLLIAQGLTILAAAGKLLIDREDKPAARQDGKEIIQGVLDLIHIAMFCHKSLKNTHHREMLIDALLDECVQG
jgi:hypothetical protein